MTFVMTEVKPRDRMIESAAMLIREFGVAGTGMREIAEHAQAPRGSLQHYFPRGKDPLVATITDAAANDALRAVAAQGFDRWRDALAAALRRGGVSSGRSERVAVLAISALEGAIVMARAHRDLAALDIVAREMDLLVADLV
jgi:AcrR family transcriptional regulator